LVAKAPMSGGGAMAIGNSRRYHDRVGP
jgi:hypothetical protein